MPWSLLPSSLLVQPSFAFIFGSIHACVFPSAFQPYLTIPSISAFTFTSVTVSTYSFGSLFGFLALPPSTPLCVCFSTTASTVTSLWAYVSYTAPFFHFHFSLSSESSFSYFFCLCHFPFPLLSSIPLRIVPACPQTLWSHLKEIQQGLWMVKIVLVTIFHFQLVCFYLPLYICYICCSNNINANSPLILRIINVQGTRVDK